MCIESHTRECSFYVYVCVCAYVLKERESVRVCVVCMAIDVKAR